MIGAARKGDAVIVQVGFQGMLLTVAQANQLAEALRKATDQR